MARVSATHLLVVALGVAVAVASALVLDVRRGRGAEARRPPAGRPSDANDARTDGYVSSRACRACHPSEHASFSRTFHRTMTQDATASALVAPVDGRPLVLDGRTYTLEREGEAIVASTPEISRARVVLLTGAHREQAFWVAGQRAGELRLFPFVWMVEAARFVPRREAFLVPPDASMPNVRWNSNCIACHAVAGEPAHDVVTDAFDTRVAELGIACESCHGPGRAHAERHRDPFTRYAQHRSHAADPTIVHPGRIDAERSAALCGQCHSYAFPRDERGWWESGYAKSFRAGDRLGASRILIQPASAGASSVDADAAVPELAASEDGLFWPDGTIRVGGREYNGLVASSCYTKGSGDRRATCTSCHAMHRGDPSGMIAPSHAGDRGCTQCHAEKKAPEHTHHAPASAGSACVSCHMPRTSYALLSAVRSHRIESPSARSTLATEKPNACNLCHADRSLRWTGERLAEWYGRAEARLPDEDSAHEAARPTNLPEGLFGGIAGNAAVRVLYADGLGRPESLAALARAERSDEAFALRLTVLAELAKDPYAAVRFVAERSLRASPPRSRIAEAPDAALVRSLLARRDTRAITIAE